MSEPAVHDEKIRGWKSIAAALEVHRNTALSWYRLAVDPLPVRTDHLGVYAWRSALVAWASRRDMPLQVHDELRVLRAVVNGDTHVPTHTRATIQPIKRLRTGRVPVQ